MTQPPHDYGPERMWGSMTSRFDQYYIDLAHLTSTMSRDNKIKVGCVIVRGGQILSEGYNGTVAGTDNQMRDHKGKTLSTVIHSEANALMKLAKNGGGADGATLYCTHSCCMDCAKLILQAGITKVVYSEVYCQDAMKFIKERGITLVCIKPSDRVSTQEDIPSQLK